MQQEDQSLVGVEEVNFVVLGKPIPLGFTLRLGWPLYSLYIGFSRNLDGCHNQAWSQPSNTHSIVHCNTRVFECSFYKQVERVFHHHTLELSRFIKYDPLILFFISIYLFRFALFCLWNMHVCLLDAFVVWKMWNRFQNLYLEFSYS
jgi:hypothetical protein